MAVYGQLGSKKRSKPILMLVLLDHLTPLGEEERGAENQAQSLRT